jgi:hypothetical protein
MYTHTWVQTYAFETMIFTDFEIRTYIYIYIYIHTHTHQYIHIHIYILYAYTLGYRNTSSVAYVSA